MRFCGCAVDLVKQSDRQCFVTTWAKSWIDDKRQRTDDGQSGHASTQSNCESMWPKGGRELTSPWLPRVLTTRSDAIF